MLKLYLSYNVINKFGFNQMDNKVAIDQIAKVIHNMKINGSDFTWTKKTNKMNQSQIQLHLTWMKSGKNLRQ
jgi:hypothetical protein